MDDGTMPADHGASEGPRESVDDVGSNQLRIMFGSIDHLSGIWIDAPIQTLKQPQREGFTCTDFALMQNFPPRKQAMCCTITGNDEFLREAEEIGR
jgi:hypothetical protein